VALSRAGVTHRAKIRCARRNRHAMRQALRVR
jgi:hypothetical protein